MTEVTGGRRYYNCQMGAGRCGNMCDAADLYQRQEESEFYF